MIRDPAKVTKIDEQVAAAGYVASMAGELALMARKHGLDTLGYLLEMVRLEAENIARPASRQ
jgi:hypothetical protein